MAHNPATSTAVGKDEPGADRLEPRRSANDVVDETNTRPLTHCDRATT